MTSYTSPDRLPAPDDYQQPADSPAAFRALADAVQAALTPRPTLVAGVVSLTGDGTSQRSATATFGVTFAEPPVVILQALTGMTNADTTQNLWPSNTTTTAVQVNGVRSNSTQITVRWIAFGQIA